MVENLSTYVQLVRALTNRTYVNVILQLGHTVSNSSNKPVAVVEQHLYNLQPEAHLGCAYQEPEPGASARLVGSVAQSSSYADDPSPL